MLFLIEAFQKACQAAIAEGVEVATSEGTKKFSLTLPDQLNLIDLRKRLDGCRFITLGLRVSLGRVGTIDFSGRIASKQSFWG